MKRIARVASPISIELQKEKSHQYAEARLNNPSHTFQWATINGQKINHLFIPVLVEMSNNHCAYCDIDNLGIGSRITIDHFRPKTKHPRLSHMWINLYPCCDTCQQSKKEITNKYALRPDQENYHFDDFFTFNVLSGEIEVLPNLNVADKEKAQETIIYFGWNEYGRPTARKKEFYKMESILGENGNNPNDLSIQDFSYRYIW